MSQYSSLFNSTRIPEIGKDRLYKDGSQKHILVLRNGHFYTFTGINEFGKHLKKNNYHLYTLYIFIILSVK